MEVHAPYGPPPVDPPTERPTDAELLQLLAQHYDTEPATVVRWLDTFDADSALRQLALPL